jgi:23S rRNA (guanosine2251-2'-O)-methyltransferase
MREWIYGRNAVYETLRARRRQPFRLRVAQGAEEKGRLQEIVKLCAERKLPLEYVQRQVLDSISQGHGWPWKPAPIQHLADILQAQRAASRLLIDPDTLQDPRTWARLRCRWWASTALLPLRRTASVTPAVVNASSGASEHLLIAQANLAQAMITIKETGVWVVGLDAGAQAQPPERVRLDGPLALVVGSEGSGMRDLVRKSWICRCACRCGSSLERYDSRLVALYSFMSRNDDHRLWIDAACCSTDAGGRCCPGGCSGAWRFVLWYGAGMLGGGLFLLGGVVILLAWPRQGAAGLAFVVVMLAVLLVGCAVLGALAGWATWVMEEAVYQRYLRKRVGEAQPVEEVKK